MGVFAAPVHDHHHHHLSASCASCKGHKAPRPAPEPRALDAPPSSTSAIPPLLRVLFQCAAPAAVLSLSSSFPPARRSSPHVAYTSSSTCYRLSASRRVRVFGVSRSPTLRPPLLVGPPHTALVAVLPFRDDQACSLLHSRNTTPPSFLANRTASFVIARLSASQQSPTRFLTELQLCSSFDR